jgi:hypothetical protein
MAVVSLVPITLNISLSRGLQQTIVAANAVQAPGGAAIDLSAWNALRGKIVPATTGPAASDVTAGTVTGSNQGILTAAFASADTASLMPGTAQYVIEGQHAAADDFQVLSRGTFTLQPAE